MEKKRPNLCMYKMWCISSNDYFYMPHVNTGCMGIAFLKTFQKELVFELTSDGEKEKRKERGRRRHSKIQLFYQGDHFELLEC